MRKNKEEICQQASKIKKIEPNYGDSKNELQIMSAKRPQNENVPQTHTGTTFLLIFIGGGGPGGSGLKGPMHPKATQNYHF